MPKGIHTPVQDLKLIARIAKESKNADDFYLKMKEVFKDKFSLQQITSYWKEKSKLIPKYLIETHTEHAAPKNGLKDSETYLSEILNEMRVTNQLLNEQINLFKRLETKAAAHGTP
jgi:hypothetical protein